MSKHHVCVTVLNSMHRAHFTGAGRVLPVTRYGCYYCREIYLVADKPINEWVDGEQTALCPVCGIDSVIPEVKSIKLTKELMQPLYKQMF